MTLDKTFPGLTCFRDFHMIVFWDSIVALWVVVGNYCQIYVPGFFPAQLYEYHGTVMLFSSMIYL